MFDNYQQYSRYELHFYSIACFEHFCYQYGLHNKWTYDLITAIWYLNREEFFKIDFQRPEMRAITLPRDWEEDIARELDRMIDDAFHGDSSLPIPQEIEETLRQKGFHEDFSRLLTIAIDLGRVGKAEEGTSSLAPLLEEATGILNKHGIPTPHVDLFQQFTLMSLNGWHTLGAVCFDKYCKYHGLSHEWITALSQLMWSTNTTYWDRWSKGYNAFFDGNELSPPYHLQELLIEKGIEEEFITFTKCAVDVGMDTWYGDEKVTTFRALLVMLYYLDRSDVPLPDMSAFYEEYVTNVRVGDRAYSEDELPALKKRLMGE